MLCSPEALLKSLFYDCFLNCSPFRPSTQPKVCVLCLLQTGRDNPFWGSHGFNSFKHGFSNIAFYSTSWVSRSMYVSQNRYSRINKILKVTVVLSDWSGWCRVHWADCQVARGLHCTAGLTQDTKGHFHHLKLHTKFSFFTTTKTFNWSFFVSMQCI